MVDLNTVELVCVTWHDAHTASDTWCKLTEIDDEPMTVRTVGWLLPNTKKDHIVVVQSITTDDALDAVLCIPIGMVRAIAVCTPTLKKP